MAAIKKGVRHVSTCRASLLFLLAAGLLFVSADQAPPRKEGPREAEELSEERAKEADVFANVFNEPLPGAFPAPAGGADSHNPVPGADALPSVPDGTSASAPSREEPAPASQGEDAVPAEPEPNPFPSSETTPSASPVMPAPDDATENAAPPPEPPLLLQDSGGRLALPANRGMRLSADGRSGASAALPATLERDSLLRWRAETARTGRLILNMAYTSESGGAVRAVVRLGADTAAVLDRRYPPAPDGYAIVTLGICHARAGQVLTVELHQTSGGPISVKGLISEGSARQSANGTLELTPSNVNYTSDAISADSIDFREDSDFVVWRLALGAFDVLEIQPDLEGQGERSCLYTLFDRSGKELDHMEKSYGAGPWAPPAYLVSGNAPSDIYYLKLQKLSGGPLDMGRVALSTRSVQILESSVHIIDNEMNPAVGELTMGRNETVTLRVSAVPNLETLQNETVRWAADPALFQLDRATGPEIRLTANEAGTGTVTATVWHKGKSVSSDVAVTVVETKRAVRFALAPPRAADALADSPGCLNVVRFLSGSPLSASRYQLMPRTEVGTWLLPPGEYAYYLKGGELGYSNKAGKFLVDGVGGEMRMDVDLGVPEGNTDIVAQNYHTGALSLLPEDAKIYTPKAKSNLVADKKGRLSGWIDTREYAYWSVAFTRPGTYAVKIRLGAQGVGGTLSLLVDDDKKIADFRVPPTKGGWNAYEELDFGTLTVEEAGVRTVKLTRVYAANPHADFYTAPNVYEIAIADLAWPDSAKD